MMQITEIKNRIVGFIGSYESFLLPVLRFFLALVGFMMIRQQTGYSSLACQMNVLVVLAIICAILPAVAIIWFGAALILLNLYALSMSCALVFLLIFLVIILLYFRFSPKNTAGMLLTPMAFQLNIPYVMPVACGLIGEPYSVASVICGTVCYYLISGIKAHASEISEMEASADIGLTEKINLALGQVLGNKELYLVVAVLIASTLLVYFIRRMQIDHAWTFAILTGILVQMMGLFAGYMILQVSGKTLWLMLGSIISIGLAYLLEFIFMDLDYSRVERVQFEDDDFYYYVKAVPKNSIGIGQKKEIRFTAARKKAENADPSEEKNE